jgi:hypothetical protein
VERFLGVMSETVKSIQVANNVTRGYILCKLQFRNAEGGGEELSSESLNFWTLSIVRIVQY